MRARAARSFRIYPGGGIYEYGDAAQAVPDPLTLGAPAVAMVAVPGTAGAAGSGGASASTPGSSPSSSTPGGSTPGSSTPGASTPGSSPGSSTPGGSTSGSPTGPPTSGGYWVAAADGEVAAVDGAPYFGSAAELHLYAPIVGMAATPDGHGYWLVALDGGVFTFGDAAFYGSMGGKHLAQPIVGMAATPDGHGYWLVAADGGVFTFGDAAFYGSLGGKDLQSGISGMAATPHGTGYWLLEWNGAVFPFGTAKSFGAPSGSPTASPFKAIVPTPDGGGYALLEPDGFDYTFADPTPAGGYPKIVAAAASQIQPDPDSGYFCSPYGQCEPWCALFLTWAWQQGGIPIPSYAFVGDIYSWAATHGRVLPPSAHALAGDAVLYGTGPQTASTAVHVGVVAQVWPDGAVVTIEGDAGPGVTGHLAVVVNGPFLPSDATASANFPVFALAQP